LSLIVFGAATAEFVLLAPFGNSTFFLLVVLTAVEFLAGLVIGVRNRSRRVRAEAPVAAPAPVRREPVAPVTPTPVPAERVTPEPRRPDPVPVDRSPAPDVKVEDLKPTPPVVTPTEAAREPESKPTPSLTTLQAAENSYADRKIADWNVSHLIKGNEAEPAKDVSDKPVDPPAAPKP
jgi:hypothetical protein